jgi:uncharacterized membrane protein (DUF2068 family)
MERRRERLVPVIGVFKLVKAAVLVSAGLVLLLGAPKEIALHLEHAFQWLGISAGRTTIRWLIERVWGLDSSAERRLALFSMGYAAVFLVEGVGLLLRRHWAEWLTVFVTGSFIPLEVYELARHFGAGKVIALILNVAIVVYLARLRLRDRHARRAANQPTARSGTARLAELPSPR